MSSERCTLRKHVVEKGDRRQCDCGKVFLGKTVAGNAYVVTINRWDDDELEAKAAESGART